MGVAVTEAHCAQLLEQLERRGGKADSSVELARELGWSVEATRGWRVA
jgi:hypothetical protein